MEFSRNLFECPNCDFNFDIQEDFLEQRPDFRPLKSIQAATDLRHGHALYIVKQGVIAHRLQGRVQRLVRGLIVIVLLRDQIVNEAIVPLQDGNPTHGHVLALQFGDSPKQIAWMRRGREEGQRVKGRETDDSYKNDPRRNIRGTVKRRKRNNRDNP